MPEPDCSRHEKEIDRLRAEAAHVDAILIGLGHTLEQVQERIPDKLGETLILIAVKVDNAIRDLAELKALVRSDVISRAEFTPVKNIVYGMVGLILTSVLVALVALVVVRK